MLLDGYIRVSQVRGRKGERFISPAAQREDIARWISSHGAELGEMFEELDESGGRADRPLLMEAVARIENGESEGIVVSRLNRFGRSLLQGLELIEHIRNLGGTLVSVQQGFDLNTSTGQLVANILFSVAEWERDQTRDSWAEARRRRIASGRHICSTVPIGYRKSDDGRLEIDPHVGPVIRGLFERRAGKAGIQELLVYMRHSPIKTHSGVPFSHRHIYTIIKNPVYKGTAHSGSYINPDAHAPLVDSATWQLCQSSPRPPQSSVESLATGLVRCASCGGKMISMRNKGVHADSHSYRCCRPAEICARPASAAGSELDPLIEEFLFLHTRKRRAAPSDKRVARAAGAMERAAADLAKYRDNIGLQRTLGIDSFEAGLAKRVQVLERRTLELARVKRTGEPPHVDPATAQSKWSRLSCHRRHEIVASKIELIVVERGTQPVIERTWIFRTGQGPLLAANEPLDFKPPREGTARFPAHRPWGEELIDQELSQFLKGRERVWPAYVEFASAGRARLYAQVMEWGGPYYWGKKLGFHMPFGSEHWNRLRVRAALKPYLAGVDRWPTGVEFQRAGLRPLFEALSRHGGREYWAKEFGLEYAPRDAPRWRWPRGRLEKELGEFLAGRPSFPSSATFRAEGKANLYAALSSYGGLEHWAKHFGLPTARQVRDRRKEALKGRNFTSPFLS